MHLVVCQTCDWIAVSGRHQAVVLCCDTSFSVNSMMIADVEEALKSSKANSLSVAHVRNQIVGILNRPVRHNPNLTPLETRALNELQSNSDIIVLPSDKGRATVIMDRDDYNSKLSEMLSDTTTYKKLNHDPSAALDTVKFKPLWSNLRSIIPPA